MFREHSGFAVSQCCNYSSPLLFCLYQEYETKSGRAGPGNPTSPRQNVRKNLDFEPLSTTALILEDRPAYVNTRSHAPRYFGCWTIPHFSFTPFPLDQAFVGQRGFVSCLSISPSFLLYQSSAGSLESIQCPALSM